MIAETIDIIYCYRNRDLARVKRSLDSLAVQTNKHFTVIFVDYGSDEAIAAKTKELCDSYPFCRYTFIDTRGMLWNRADALNYGFGLSNAEYVFTSDIDMVFVDSFIDFLHKTINPETATFFSVGYLSEKDSANLDIKQLSSLRYTKSETFALGMVLASKTLISSINGYNAFYSLWGTEDNDIQFRMQQAGYKTAFFDKKILMLHQYHPASSTDESVLPEGWLQFMKDYFDSYTKKEIPFKGLAQVTIPLDRPAAKMFTDRHTHFHTVSARNLFIRHTLMSDLLQLNAREGKAYVFPVNDMDPGFVYKASALLNSVSRKLNIPVRAYSLFKSQYTSKNTIRDEVYFVLKSMEHLVKDYYLTISDREIRLVIVKQ